MADNSFPLGSPQNPQPVQLTSFQITIILLVVLFIFIGIVYMKYLDYKQAVVRYDVEGETVLQGINLLTK